MWINKTIKDPLPSSLSYLLNFQLFLQPVKLQLVIDEPVDEVAKLNFRPLAICPKGDLCLKVGKNEDSITFNGKLTEVPKRFRATLTSNSFYSFEFGYRAPTNRPGVVTPTSDSTAVSQSSTSDSNNNGDTTIPTTSSGVTNLSSFL